MVIVVNLNAKILELTNEQLDFVLLRIPSHISNFFVLISGNDLVNGAGHTVCDGHFGFVG